MMTVNLTPEAEEMLQRLMSKGDFESEAEAVTEALALLELQREREFLELKAKIDEGIASSERGESIPMDVAFRQLRENIKQRYNLG